MLERVGQFPSTRDRGHSAAPIFASLQLQLRHEGKQFGRFPCGFTPAFGRVIFARWKPGPFEAVVGPEGRAGAGRALRDVTHLKSEMGTPNLGVADQMWATR